MSFPLVQTVQSCWRIRIRKPCSPIGPSRPCLHLCPHTHTHTHKHTRTLILLIRTPAQASSPTTPSWSPGCALCPSGTARPALSAALPVSLRTTTAPRAASGAWCATPVRRSSCGPRSSRVAGSGAASRPTRPWWESGFRLCERAGASGCVLFVCLVCKTFQNCDLRL